MKLQAMLDHHNWANQKYFDYVLELDDSAYETKLPGSDKSIAIVLRHLHHVFISWYAEIIGERASDYPELDVRDTIHEIKIMQTKIDAYVQGNDISRVVTMQFREDHKPVGETVEEIVFNFITHSAYHRGQLAFLLRYNGFEGIEDTDYNPYRYNLDNPGGWE